MQKTRYKTADGLTVYDLDSQAAELWAVAGPDGFVGEIDPDDLPDGFRWVDGWEWETLNEVDYSEVAGKVFEYKFATDSEQGEIVARDFTEAKKMPADRLTDDVLADGAFGWVEDLDGYRHTIGEVS